MSKTQQNGFPTPKDWFLGVGLYKTHPFTQTSWRGAKDVEYFCGSIDSFCIGCGKESVFLSSNEPSKAVSGTGSGLPRVSDSGYEFLKETRTFEVEFSCTRNPVHQMLFIFRLAGSTLTKIGQYPSFADLHLNQFKHYKSVLSAEQLKELNTAAGLYSHGVGAGSFVYIRRVFESLIASAHQVESTTKEWDEVAYVKARMDERIKLLEHALPAVLVENKAVYAILSSGIHELDEDQCLTYFEPVRQAIELILEEKLHKQAKEKKATETRNAIAKIKGEIKEEK